MELSDVTIQTIERDIILAEGIFGREAVIWPLSGSWIRINGYRLPPFYNRPKTDLLIVMPPHYGLIDVSLQEFYIDKGLRVNTKTGWKTIPHYYQDDGLNKYSADGWSWFCLHPRSWKKTDNILTFLKLIDLMLQNPYKWNT